MMEFNFEKTANELLESILAYLEQKYGNEADIELDDGVLQFTIHSNNKPYSFVINRNSASQKVWYSSPVSKPKYYIYSPTNSAWMETTNKTTIMNDLQNDEKAIIIPT